MKQRINIAWLLMMVCMIMLTASVLPHHHHKGLLCLQHDATEKECSEGLSRHQPLPAKPAVLRNSIVHVPIRTTP